MQHQELFEKVFNKSAADADVQSFSAGIAERYPYFSLAHFYSLAATGGNMLQHQPGTQRAALHFPNPFLLKQALAEKKAAIAEVDAILEEQQDALPVTEPITVGDAEVEVETEVKDIPGVPVDAVIETKQEQTATIAEKKPELSPARGPLIFEPLHMTDYFASQGIKLTDDMNPNDKLGKQLRSFTDWLKTMKKVHESKLPAGSEQLDASVQRLAEKSNKDAEILTEAMAEAYAQQGKKGKAIETYQKLSLLNPAKSAFFAAKIENLNNQ